jgi:hypothetical protein
VTPQAQSSPNSPAGSSSSAGAVGGGKSIGSHTAARHRARAQLQSGIASPEVSRPRDSQWHRGLRNRGTSGLTPSSPSESPASTKAAPRLGRPHSTGGISRSSSSSGVPQRREHRTLVPNQQPIPLRGRRANASQASAVSMPHRADKSDAVASAASVRFDPNQRQGALWESSLGEGPPGSSIASEHWQQLGNLSGPLALQQQLQDAQERLLALGRDQRGLASHLDTPSSLTSGVAEFSPTSYETPPQAHSQCSTAEGLPSDYRPSDPERPAWLLADGRLRASMLEGENHALRRAVARARGENAELAARRRAAEERNQALELQNQAASEALRRTTLFHQRASTPTSCPSAASAKELADKAEGSALSGHTERRRADSEEARSRLLQASLVVGRRMEEIFARHSALQALYKSKTLTDSSVVEVLPQEAEPSTEAGSSRASGGSAEGSSPS